MKNSVFLVEPEISYKEQFQALVRAYQSSGEADYFDMYKDALDDFDKYVTRLHNHAKGIDIPEAWAPAHTYWLTNEEGRILGVIRVRTCNDSEFVRTFAGNIGYDISPLHRNKGYGTTILELGLKKAKALGLDRALITCFYDNIGSIRIIENNGGVFESEMLNEGKNKPLRRYWIEL